MPEKGLRPGFTYPARTSEFGVNFAEFQIVGRSDEYVVPGSKNRPLGPRVFAGATPGPCRIEVHSPGGMPFDYDPKNALFVSPTVDFLFGTSQNAPESFAVIRSKHAKELAADLQTFVGKPIALVFRPSEEERTLKPDPYNKGWTLGWGVYREDPWHFGGLYLDRESAQEKAKELGSGYSVAYGSNRDSSHDFITTGYEEH